MGNSQSSCDDDEIEIRKDPKEKHSFWTGWHLDDFGSLSTLKPKLRVGDMVAVKRGAIEHFVLYIGEDHCIHFYAAEGKSCGDARSILDVIVQEINIIPDSWGNKPGTVALEPIDSVIGKDKCRIDNRTEHVLAYGVNKRRKDFKIVKEAKKMWEKARTSPPQYNVARYNCETFALELRYGVKITSEQIRTAVRDEL